MSTKARIPKRRRQRKTSPKLWFILGLGLALILLAMGSWLALKPTGGEAASPAATLGNQVGDVAPDFTIPTLDGESFTLSERRGKPTIIFFMAYWCGTCIPEGQALARIAQEYGQRVNIIAIDVDPSSTPQALAQFKRAAGDGAFTWAFDSGQQVTQSYLVRSLDTTSIVDPDGVISYRDEYPSPYQTLKDALARLDL